MAVKRTNNVSSEISKIDRRVKTLESSVGTVSSVSGVVVTGAADDENPPTTGGLRSNSAPFQYKRVYEAWIYGPKVTGNTSRAELYFEDDPEIAPGDYVRVQGINGNSASEIDISSSNNGYKVFATDTPPWDNVDVREPGVPGQLRRVWRDTPPGNIDYTVFYNPVVVPPADSPTNAGLQLISTRLMDSVTASNTTVTVNFNSNHRFEVGDVLYWDLPESLLDGYADKLFKVSNVVDSNTVQYQLETSLAAPVSLNSGDLTGKFVYAVAQHYVEEGTTWVDTSVEPNKIYIWKDYRWYDTADPIGDVAAVKDGIAPSPVTNLTATSTTIPGVNGQGGTAEITVSWTPPTTRSNGDPIDDYLGYYEIQYKRSTELNWTGKLEVDGSASSAIIRDPFIRLQTQYDIRVYVYDIMEQASTPVSTTVTTTNFSEVLNAPSTPILTTRLGTITVTWDGLDSVGNTPPQGVQYVEVHYSTTTGFTPSGATLYTTFPITLEGNYAVVSDLNYNTTYYFKLIFVRSDGYTNEKSAASAQASAQVSPLVDTDIIYSTLNNWPFNGGVVPAGALASGAISASNMFGSNVVVQNAIAANAIGANQIAANAVIAGKIGADAITANTIAAGAITAGKIAANAIEADKIAAGAITASIIGSKEIELKATPTSTQRIVLNASGITAYNGGDTTFFINGVSGTINAAAITVNNLNASNITTGSLSADRIAANSITATQISSAYVYAGTLNADNITAGTLNVNRIGSGTLPVGVIYAGEISADKITSGELVGRVIRTVPAGNTAKRIIVNTSGEIVFFNSGAVSEAGRIEATAGGISINGASGGTLAVSGTPVIGWNSSGISLLQSTTQTGSLSATGAVSSNGGFDGGSGTTIGASVSTRGGIQASGNLTISGVASLNGVANVASTLNCSGGIFRLQLAGGGTTGASFNDSGALIRTSSSQRYKQDIQNLTISYQDVLALEPKKFRRIDEVENNENARYYPGFIAEDLAGTPLDIFVFYSKDENGNQQPEGIHYPELTAALISAIKHQSALISNLDGRIAALEGTT